MATSGQFYWPSVGSSVAAYGQFRMAANNFLAVMRTRSFSNASRELGMTQPPLSQAIQKIERESGLVLFERNSRNVTPTLAAHALVPEIESLLRRSEELDLLTRKLRSRPADRVSPLTVRIGCVPSVLVGLLPQIMPYVRGLDIIIYERNSVELRKAVDRNDIDVAFVRDWPSSDPRVRLLLEEPMVVVLPAGHPLASNEILSLIDLANEAFVMFPRETAPAAFDAITAGCARAGFALNVQSLATNDQAVFGMVACRLGVALAPAMLQRMHCAGVVLRPLDAQDIAVPLGIIAPDNDPQGHGEMFYEVSCRVIGKSQQ